jgi:hypothetical protein
VDVVSFVVVFALLVSMGKLVLWTPWMLDSHMPHSSSNAHFNVSLPVGPLHRRITLSSDFVYIPSWFAAKSFHLAVVIRVAQPCLPDDMMLRYYQRTCDCGVQLKCIDAHGEPVSYIRLGELKKRDEFYYATDYPTPRPNPAHGEMDATRPRCSLDLVLTRPCNMTAKELGPVFVYWQVDAIPSWSATDWIPRTLYNILSSSS